MAYNIKPLRQQNLFDNFSLGNLMDDPGYDYGDEQSQSRGPTFYGGDRPPDAESRYGNNTGQYSTGPSDTENEGLEYQNPISDVSRVSTQSRSALRSSNTDADAEDAKRIMEIINQTYTPTNTARDRFGNLLDNPPEREEPSFARRMVGFGVGLGNKGMGVAPSVGEQEKVLYAPYMRDMAEWTAKATPFQQAASLENSANSIERQLASGVATNAVAAQRNRQQSEAAQARTEETQRHNTETEGIQRSRLALQQAVQLGGVKQVLKDGNRVYVVYGDGRTVDTGLPGDAVSDMELANLNNAAKLAQVKEAGNQDRLTNAAPGGSGTTAKTADEFTKQEQIRMKNIYMSLPQYREFFKVNNGVYELGPRPEYGWFSMDATDEAKMAQYDELAKHIYPNYQPPTGAKQPQQAPQVSPTANQGLGPQQTPAMPTGAQSGVPIQGRGTGIWTGNPPLQFPPAGGWSSLEKPQSISEQQDQADVQSGKRLVIYRKDTGERGTTAANVPNLSSVIATGLFVMPNDPEYAQMEANWNAQHGIKR